MHKQDSVPRPPRAKQQHPLNNSARKSFFHVRAHQHTALHGNIEVGARISRGRLYTPTHSLLRLAMVVTRRRIFLHLDAKLIVRPRYYFTRRVSRSSANIYVFAFVPNFLGKHPLLDPVTSGEHLHLSLLWIRIYAYYICILGTWSRGILEAVGSCRGL